LRWSPLGGVTVWAQMWICASMIFMVFPPGARLA
jgi:hypothetical protein